MSFNILFRISPFFRPIFPILVFRRLLSIALSWKTRATEATSRLLIWSGSIKKLKGKSAAFSLEVRGTIKTVGSFSKPDACTMIAGLNPACSCPLT